MGNKQGKQGTQGSSVSGEEVPAPSSGLQRSHGTRSINLNLSDESKDALEFHAEFSVFNAEEENTATPGSTANDEGQQGWTAALLSDALYGPAGSDAAVPDAVAFVGFPELATGAEQRPPAIIRALRLIPYVRRSMDTAHNVSTAHLEGGTRTLVMVKD
jgi:hypothetical protein